MGSRLLFDKKDHVFLRMVNDVLENRDERDQSQRKFYPHLHPRGIKELAESRGLRMGYAAVHLLDSLEVGRRDERLAALRSLRDEVLSASKGSLPRNTARVLLQIMKDMVRSRGDHDRQLEQAHEFRLTASGKPSYVRRQLRKYHLLELPEEWNHLAFDDHVHDVNTKGRKSATHLIMDAWIKGIRRLRVIYYNYIEPPFAAELLEAAEIMGLEVRIGIEFPALFRGRYVQFIWVPRGFQGSQVFLAFLNQPSVRRLFDEGRTVSEYQQGRVLEVLDWFNRSRREKLNRDFGINLRPLNPADFLEFVKPGQASMLHLAKFIHTALHPLIVKKAVETWREEAGAKDGEQDRLAGRLGSLGRMDAEVVYNEFLNPARNPGMPDPTVPAGGPEVPEMLKLDPLELLHRLEVLRTGYRVTLNLSNLWAEDVLELLYDCKGFITRLEIFNLKDYAENKVDQIPEISALQTAINDGAVIKLKRIIREIIARVEASDAPDRNERLDKLNSILADILNLISYYKATGLKSRIGSDSTGHSARIHGMGLAVVDSLPRRARRLIHDPASNRMIIPFRQDVRLRSTYIRRNSNGGFEWLSRALGDVAVFRPLFYRRQDEWVPLEQTTRMAPHGNIVTLGGRQEEQGAGGSGEAVSEKRKTGRLSWTYLNSRLKLFLKIAAGFIPAFATFALSYDWPLLKYGGAPIWFAITGVRNVVQAVLGGGGLRRSPLLRWNNHISWERISDSLLFTGFSVPLLDLVIKNLLLDKALGINVSNNPALLYTVIALANGLYLSSHNIFRGLPRAAAAGNFFRSLLSIPIALLFNIGLAAILSAAGVPGVEAVLQKWAAVISKAASDMAAGVIEGTADRFHNIRLRTAEYRDKLALLMEAYAYLEICLPQAGVGERLKDMAHPQEDALPECRELENLIIAHSLDLLYFWMYQPRARTAFKELARNLSGEELQILVGCEQILRRQREISQLFIDGIIGRNFSRGLSFYLDHADNYLSAQQKILNRLDPSAGAAR